MAEFIVEYRSLLLSLPFHTPSHLITKRIPAPIRLLTFCVYNGELDLQRRHCPLYRNPLSPREVFGKE